MQDLKDLRFFCSPCLDEDLPEQHSGGGGHRKWLHGGWERGQQKARRSLFGFRITQLDFINVFCFTTSSKTKNALSGGSISGMNERHN